MPTLARMLRTVKRLTSGRIHRLHPHSGDVTKIRLADSMLVLKILYGGRWRQLPSSHETSKNRFGKIKRAGPIAHLGLCHLHRGLCLRRVKHLQSWTSSPASCLTPYTDSR
uniref:Uncharacterized protein n=1 Tax=Schistocephalus solidus TaxID=70667 RepID=A0A0X3PLZ4_SCHSO